MIEPNKLRLLFFLFFLNSISYAQDIHWMLGTWKATDKTDFIKTIFIDSVYGNNFTGTRTIEARQRNRTKIITSLSGHFNKDELFMDDGENSYKKGNWAEDCAHCPMENKIIIAGDSIFISRRVQGCKKYCDGISNYYRLFCDYDTTTQRYLVNLFGTFLNTRTFIPCIKKPIPVASKNNEDPVKNAENTAKKKQQQIQDSLRNVPDIAKKKQQQVDDSLKVAAGIAKKRQQEIQDSLKTAANIAKKKEQQRTEDSLRNVADAAKKRQQQVDDSLKVAAAIAKKRQQEMQDSLKTAANIAKKKEQQRTEDSLRNVAEVKKRQQEIDDSLKTAASIIKKKQQEDSAKTVVSVVKPDDKSKALLQRDNLLLQTYHIIKPDILIELFDNAQLDGDRVSVYHNNVLIIDNKTLLKEPITLTIHADANSRIHEFILVAENLGSIPPNTALMRITADGKVYKLSVKTDLKTNAKIIFYFDGN